MTAPPDPGGGGGGTLPFKQPLPAGTGYVTFSQVTGTVSFESGETNGPDGSNTLTAHISAFGGISGLTDSATFFYMVGVFLKHKQPASPPPTLDFTNDYSFTSLAPRIGQVFFIGDGLTGTGTGQTQHFQVPQGATTLYLGFADCGNSDGLPGFYGDNSGSLTGSLQFHPAAPPPGREWPSLAFDPPRDELVLFGGDNGSTVLGDTWTRRPLKGAVWAQQNPARSPSPRTGAAMVYDAATSQLLLFGGSKLTGTGGGFLGDTWEWTGTTWRQLHPAASPPARHNADMIYDAATGNVVLFGGYDGHYLGDTWTWNGSTWTQQHPATAPAPRDTGSFAYDAATGTGVVFGGFNGTTAFTDTWTWNGSAWTQLHPATAPGAIGAWMAAYDAITQQVLLFPQGTGQTWAWNGTTWTQLSPATAPAPRSNAAMTANTTTGNVVLFGGHSDSNPTTYLNDTWNWNGTTWHRK